MNQEKLNKLDLKKSYTYKALCKILQEPYYSGNQKNCQLKNWKQYFEYNKKKAKFNIVKIYKEPVANIKSNKLEFYKEFIEVLLYLIFVDGLGRRVAGSNALLYNRGEIMGKMALFSSKIYEGYIYKGLSNSERNIVKKTLLSTVNTFFNYRIDKMVKDNIITLKKVVAFKLDNGEYFLCSDSKLEIWDEVAENILKEKNVKKHRLVYNNKWKAFEREVKNQLKIEEGVDIEFEKFYFLELRETGKKILDNLDPEEITNKISLLSEYMKEKQRKNLLNQIEKYNKEAKKFQEELDFLDKNVADYRKEKEIITKGKLKYYRLIDDRLKEKMLGTLEKV